MLIILDYIVSIVTVIGIVFVAYQAYKLSQQTRLSSASTVAGLYQEVSSHMLDVDEIFIQRPHLRAYFYDNKDVSKLKGDDYQQVMAVAEMIVDLMDLTVVLREMARESKSDKMCELPLESWETYFKDMFKSSPALRDFLKGHKVWYVNQIVKIYLEAENEISTAEEGKNDG